VNTLVGFEVFYLINTRYLKESSLSLDGLFGNSYALGAIGLVIVLQVMFTYVPFMQNLFGVAPIHPASWTRIVLVTAAALFIVETEKFMLRKFWPKLHP
jgi:magnesium-transporting ATPase (P-type)